MKTTDTGDAMSHSVNADHYVTITLAPHDARDLLEAMLDRPHVEEWSTRVAQAVTVALTPKLTVVKP